MNQLNFAYAAGLLDGDGCYVIEKRNQKKGGVSYTTHVTLNQVDPANVNWMQATFGGFIREYKVHHTTLAYRKPNSLGAKTFYRWTLWEKEALTSFLENVLPYAVGKKEQVELSLEVRKLLNNRNWKTRPAEITAQLEQTYLRSKQLKGKK